MAKELNPNEMVSAKDYNSEPDMCFEWAADYILLQDTSMTGNFKNMIQAINHLSQRGWEAISMTSDGSQIMTLMHIKTRKRKNEDLE